jgi:hypothetical protein
MKKILFTIIILASLCLVQCGKEKANDFLITLNAVGKLEKTHTVKDLETIFATDSIVKDTFDLTIGSETQKIKIYEKGGKHLLTLTPRNDSLQHFENIRIYDSRYVTENGIGLSSTFGEISQKYEIKKLMTLLNNVVVFPKNSDVYFTIDKKELPASLRYTTESIDAVQIPDAAKIKYMMVGWAP